MAAGEGPDIAEWYRLYRGVLRSRLQQQCGDADLAEEIVQEAFLAARKYAHTFDPQKGEARSWLTVIASNLLKRRAMSSAQRGEAKLEFEPADERSSAASSLEERLDAEAIRAAVDGLPEPERSILRLKYFENKTLVECAAQLGLSPSTTARRLTDALKMMRNELNKRGIGLN